MAIYQCTICGAIFDEEKEGRTLAELTECPVCKQPISKFKRIDSDEQPQETVMPKGSLAYDPQYERQDKNSRFMKEIHEMAVSGKSIDSAMGTLMPLPGWDDILLLGAQLNPPPLLDHDPDGHRQACPEADGAGEPDLHLSHVLRCSFTGGEDCAFKRQRHGENSHVQRRGRHSGRGEGCRL